MTSFFFLGYIINVSSYNENGQENKYRNLFRECRISSGVHVIHFQLCGFNLQNIEDMSNLPKENFRLLFPAISSTPAALGFSFLELLSLPFSYVWSIFIVFLNKITLQSNQHPTVDVENVDHIFLEQQAVDISTEPESQLRDVILI